MRSFSITIDDGRLATTTADVLAVDSREAATIAIRTAAMYLADINPMRSRRECVTLRIVEDTEQSAFTVRVSAVVTNS